MRKRSAGSALYCIAAAIGLLVPILSLSACGGGGVVSGGIGGSGYVAGPIEEIGSIVVDGIRFDVEDAVVLVNGESASSDDLAPGMFVGIHGVIDEGGTDGTASLVEYDETVSGPLASVSLNRRRLVVLDQVILLEDETRLVGLTRAALQRGVVVTVSGSKDADAAIVATRIQRRAAATDCRVVGDVAELSRDGSEFYIGELRIDATQALLIGGALEEGDSVAVVADACEEEGNVLLARAIRRLDATRPTPPGPARSVQGFVTEGLVGDRFRLRAPGIGPVEVERTAQTRFEGGNEGDLLRNARVRVLGRAGGEGLLRATRIVFLPAHPGASVNQR